MSNSMRNVAATAGKSSETPLGSSRWSDWFLRRLAVDMENTLAGRSNDINNEAGVVEL